MDCDRWGAEWRKRQEHWQVPFVADCWLLIVLAAILGRLCTYGPCKVLIVVALSSSQWHPTDITRFHELLRRWRQVGISTCYPSAAERPSRAAS